MAMCAVVGCGTGVQTLAGPRRVKSKKTALYRGDPGGAPSMESLPAPDVPRTEFSHRMKLAWMLSEESFDVPDPPVPTDRSAASLQYWSDHELKDWIQRKNDRVEAARAELNEAAAENHRQLIMSGALLGLVYEDVALVLIRMPVPNELLAEPEIAEIYKEVMVGQARPYVDNARTAYSACAANAKQLVEGMRHWSYFCESRADGLPGAMPVKEGTTVEVIRD